MRFILRLSPVLTVALCVSSTFAQNSNSGDIRGTVMDPTGAVVEGVTVTVLDVDKGVTKTYVTDSAGLYDTGPIVTDHYTVSFSKAGFDRYVRGPITLNNETLTVNGTLKVGSATETVQVTDDVPLLTTENATQATTLPEQEMQDLPNFASWENFVVLMPGTSGAPSAQGGENPGQTASVNGNAVFYNVLGDGITMSLPSNGNSYDYNFDTLQEVQIVSSVPSAQYENGGVIYNQISKGGTSRYHGDVFEYFQNNALNAAPYGFGQKTSVPILHANYFGGSVGGYVPGRMFAKKLFFFFNYDYSQTYGGSANGFETVPTAAMSSGDFTGMTVNGAPLLIYDPTTQTVDSKGIVHRKSFLEEYGANKIPDSMISPAAKAIQQYFPKPNVTNPTVIDGITTNNVFYNIPTNSPGYGYFYRVDWDVTPKNRVTATDFYNHGTFDQLSNDCPINCTSAQGDGRTSEISDVWTISTNMINEAHMGMSLQNNLFIPESIKQGYPSKMGLAWAKADVFPEVNINGGIWGLGPGTNAIQHQIMFEPSDVVTLIEGKHVLHFGGEFLDQQINTTLWGNVDAGAVNFTGAYTASTQGDALSGIPYADFLLGQVNSWSANNTPEFYPRMKTVQMFVQDDIKLRPNFTLNVGLRWEGWDGMSEAHGNERSWDPTVTNPGTDPFGRTNTLGAMWYAKTHANGRTKVIAPQWNIWLPRFGASWQVNPKTVFRGGVGLYAYNFQEGPSAYSEIGFAEGQSGNEGDNTNGVLPVLLLDQDGSVNNQGAAGASINSYYLNAPTTPDALNGQSVNYALYHEPINKIWQYNFEFQRDLGYNLATDIAYVGSHGFDLMYGVDLNQIPESKLAPDDASGPTNARPYPNYESIGGSKLIGISNYNALQATIQKRLSSGVQFNFNYTWSKFLNESDPCAWNCATSYEQNTYVPRSNYGPSAFDIRSMFKGRVIYHLPVGRGQRFLNNSTLVDAILGGWQTAATIQLQSGNPFTVVTANDNSFSQSGNQYPNVVKGAGLYAGAHQIGPDKNWFNEGAFSQPAEATFGDSGRNTVRGPGLSNINFSLGKNFTIWHESKFQLRMDSNNILNHPSFGHPNNYWGPGQTSSITSLTVGGRSVELLGKISF
jgi:hypothetical protein